jgi:hypothetical protein
MILKSILLICLVVFISTHKAQSLEDNVTNITITEAKNIANEYLIKTTDYEIKSHYIKIDDSNSEWNKFIKEQPRVLTLDDVKELHLENKTYWAIYFGHKRKKGYVYFGGDGFIFIDRKSGEVIGILRGK